MSARSRAEAAALVILGASGDLARRKLVPAVHSLHCDGLLPAGTRVVGLARTEMDDEQFRDHLLAGIEEYARHEPDICARWSEFRTQFSYLAGNYDDPHSYQRLAEHLARLDAEPGSETRGNRLFYLAVPPDLVPGIVEQLGRAGLNQGNGGWARIIFEKPFGHDLASARALNRQVHAVFQEQQVYRIDHYLGKETVQNIVTFRFGNAIFEPIWNRRYVDYVQITVAEEEEVGRRAGYYERAGVLRDMFQNHLMQLLTLTAMEPPAVWEADALRDEKVKVIRAIRPGAASVRGQYEGYRHEAGVAPASTTPTYAALQLFVDNWRWQGVPFYLRSGKSLARKMTEVAVVFKCVPPLLFPRPAGDQMSPNFLSLCLQPNEGIHLHFEAKEPGAGMRTRSVGMEFRYADDFRGSLPDAYERLLLDALQGDASLFARADEIELAWSLIDPLVAGWQEPGAPPLVFYPRKSWGPAESNALIPDGSLGWIVSCDHSQEGKP